jgi:hypothetical protein
MFNLDDLEISRDPVTRTLHCKQEPLEEILRFNGIQVDLFRDKPYFDMLCVSAVMESYRVHLARGGRPNPIPEQFGVSGAVENRAKERSVAQIGFHLRHLWHPNYPTRVRFRGNASSMGDELVIE